MKVSSLKTIGFLLALAAIVYLPGCSADDSSKKQIPEAPLNNNALINKSAESSSATLSPCANRYYPVKNGRERNYDNTVGGKTTLTMEYTDGAPSFTEVTTIKDVNVKHVWNCTSEGLAAASYGSAADFKNMQLEPKLVSGVTLPNEDEIKIGKTWTTVYKATGISELGAVDSTVELRNKIVSLDDEVKTPGGTFKAVKVDIEIVADMKFGGRKMPVPNIKSAAWFAPDVGMVKSTGNIGGLSNSMEYAGGN